MSKKKYPPLSCIVDRLEDHQVVLSFDCAKERQELVLPQRHLPLGIKEGDCLQVEFFTDQMAKSKRSELARQMLVEILQGGK